MEEAIAHIKKVYPPSREEIPVKKLFLSKYGQFPQKIRISPVSKESGTNVVFHVKSVLDRIPNNNEYPIVHYRFHPCSKKCYPVKQLLTVSDGIMIYLECMWVTNYTNNSNKSIQPDYIPGRHFLITEEIEILYLIEHETFVQQLANDLIIDDTLSLIEPRTAMLRLVGKHKDRCNGPGSLYLMSNTFIRKPHINDLALSYGGQDFLNVHNKIISWLNTKDANGLVLLHGAPGSGKYSK
jgi:hypothetical protein